MSVTCRHVRQLHDAYVDGELSAGLTAEVHAHLLQCPACQHEVEMVRACGDVIRMDRAEPQLDAKFAARIVANLPQRAPAKPVLSPRFAASLETRRSRRERLLRSMLYSSLPAAAAMLFFAVMIRPADNGGMPPTMVKGVAVERVGVNNVVAPTISAVQDTRRAVQDINSLCEIAVNDAARNASAVLGQAAQDTAPTSRPHGGISLLDFFMPTFEEIVTPADAPVAPPAESDPEIVRF